MKCLIIFSNLLKISVVKKSLIILSQIFSNLLKI